MSVDGYIDRGVPCIGDHYLRSPAAAYCKMREDDRCRIPGGA